MTNITEKVLFIGPDYKNHRGGMGAVLEIYANNMVPFKFIPDYKAGSSIKRIRFFLSSLFAITRVLLVDKKLKLYIFIRHPMVVSTGALP